MKKYPIGIRMKQAVNKLIFCYRATTGISSFLALIWHTKIYRVSKNRSRYTKYADKFFSISLSVLSGRKILLRTYAGDIDIFYEIFYKKIYELPQMLNRNVIIDAGANTGLATLYFLSKMPSAIIYCIEPDPDNFMILQKNLKAEIESGSVIPVMAGLSVKDGFMNLESSSLKYNSGLINEQTEHSVPVITYSVETFINKYRIDHVGVFKIDIEGSEEDIFKANVSWLKSVDDVLIEFHSKQIEAICVEKFGSQRFNHLSHNTRKSTTVFHFVRSI